MVAQLIDSTSDYVGRVFDAECDALKTFFFWNTFALFADIVEE